MTHYEDMHPCDYGHTFRAVWDLGVVSHYRCSVCGAEVSDEDYEKYYVEEEEDEEEDDIADPDEEC